MKQNIILKKTQICVLPGIINYFVIKGAWNDLNTFQYTETTFSDQGSVHYIINKIQTMFTWTSDKKP